MQSLPDSIRHMPPTIEDRAMVDPPTILWYGPTILWLYYCGPLWHYSSALYSIVDGDCLAAGSIQPNAVGNHSRG